MVETSTALQLVKEKFKKCLRKFRHLKLLVFRILGVFASLSPSNPRVFPVVAGSPPEGSVVMVEVNGSDRSGGSKILF